MKTENFREKLGARLVLWSTLALTVFAIAALAASAYAGADALRQTSQTLLSSLLPLFGTWVGTVLAFYYSKENFEAANANTLDMEKLVAQKLSTARVSQYMMRQASIISITIAAGKSIGDVAVSEVESRFDTVGENGQRISRLIFVDSTGACIAILHRSVYTEVLSLGLQDKPTFDPATGVLAPLLAKPLKSSLVTTYGELIEKLIAFVAEDRSLADAKIAMEHIPGCQDVIVTRNGDRSAPVIGWISNVDIGRASQA
jgi:hypothetical protein